MHHSNLRMGITSSYRKGGRTEGLIGTETLGGLNGIGQPLDGCKLRSDTYILSVNLFCGVWKSLFGEVIVQ